MTRRLLLTDLAIAAAFAIVVVIIAPGLAMVAIFAGLVIVVLIASAVVGRVRGDRERMRPPTRSRSRER
ncbi:MAG: hypothetical protein M3018_00505 [Actinomycetota bacterium]|nr:hypothetical protein [Actinomycetota bacterium]